MSELVFQLYKSSLTSALNHLFLTILIKTGRLCKKAIYTLTPNQTDSIISSSITDCHYYSLSILCLKVLDIYDSQMLSAITGI